MGYKKRLDRAFKDAPVLPLTMDSRYVLISDCHRGTGTSNDNFLKNQHLYFAALQYYYCSGYTYIELGDGDELWENRQIGQIIEIHSNVFWLMTLFHEKKRLFLLYGNHDMAKKSRTFRNQNCSHYFCTSQQKLLPLFPDMPIYEGIILEDPVTGQRLFLTHGHQADPLNSTFWKLARFLVRYVWKPLEHFGVLDPTSAAKNNTKKEAIEKRLSRWALEKNTALITGHTHRPAMGSSSSPYFNTGSCVHPRCITCIEISNRCLFLVKWSMNARPDRTLYVKREILAGPVCMDDLHEVDAPVE